MQTNENYITNHIEAIKQKALFLEKKEFEIAKISEYTIKYSHKDICSIEIYYGRYSDAAEVYIRFENNSVQRPEQYSIGWLSNMKKFEAGVKDIFRKPSEKVDKVADIFSLLEYLENNFDSVTNINYCRKMQNKINENFEKGIW